MDKKRILSRASVPLLAASLLAAAVFTVIALLGWLNTPDLALSDWVYQRGGLTDGEILVIGMDQRSIEQFGPMPWSRSIIADAISYLNADPETAPAVIGIDVLFVGESAEPWADEYLAETAAEGGNVVVASAGEFGAKLITDGDDFYMQERAVLAWDSPYDALRAAADTGHINAMADTDGYIRHAMLYADTPDGRVYSMPRVLYEKWCRYKGEEPGRAPDTEGGFFYLHYTGKAGAYYDGISVADLVNCEADPDYFAGKIVLIGPYASGMQDEYRTAIDHASPMFGIEIQANQIDAFRNGFFPREASPVLQAVILFAVCAFSVFFMTDRKLIHSLLIWALVCAAWIGACLIAYKAGIVLKVLWVPLFETVTLIGCVAVSYIRAQRDKRRVTATFGRYVDPAVMKELLDTGGGADQLGGKMFEIAVLFVDIRGFTTMSESLDAPTVVEIINRYLTLTTECIMRYHGTLDKFVGDCTMAFWNAPVPQDDFVYLACRAAMDMVEGSKALGQELLETYGRTVSFGVGVHVGSAVVGNIGAPKRMDYTAIGDTVNTASRLESNAPGGTIYISRAVADALGDRAKTTSLGGSIKLKGKAEGFEVLTLDSLET